jgi:hypothetical protein
VVNITRYYHHKTVYMGSKEDNIYNNIYKGLDIIKVTNYKLKDLIIPLKLAEVKINMRKGQNSNKKRLSSYINTPLPPSKCIYLGSLLKNKRYFIILNQVYQYIIIRDYKKPFYKVSF